MPLVLDGTNGVSGVDGTASNPAIEGTDSNTGIFYPAADTVAIGTGGTEALRIDSARNMGLGVTPPATFSGYTALNLSATSIYNFSASGNRQTHIYNNGFINSSGNAAYINTDAASRIYMTNGTIQFGVAGSGSANANITFNTAMTLDASGNLGVGTTSPLMRLHASGSGNYVAGLQSSNTFALLAFQASGTSGSLADPNVAIGGTGDALYMRAGGGERARITSGGVLCVGGTTARGSRLTLQCGEANSPTLGTASGGVLFGNSDSSYGTLFGTAGAGYGWIQQQRVDGTATAYDLYLQPSGGALYSIALYNNTVGATNRDVFVDNAGKVGYVSSIRASKTNIQDLTDTSWLHQLTPVTFNYRKKDEEGNYTDETDGDLQYGMIAEDVEQVRPDLCFYDEVDGQQELRGIQYSKLVPVMLKEIQKLRAEIEALKGNA